MRSIITILFCCFCYLATAQSPLQKRIDFSVNNIPLKNALQELSLISEINIAFSSNFFDEKTLVSIDVKNESISNILKTLLQDSEMTFQASGSQIILSQKRKKRRFTISGFLEDKESGERLIGVHVYAPNHNKGTASNEYGFYSLTIPEGSTEIVFSYLGCMEIIESIDLTTDLRKNVSLETSLTLSEVVVKSDSIFSTIESISNDNSNELKEVNDIPGIGGGQDPLQQAQLLPGVASGADGFGGLIVRGGNSDQNLTMLDGVPIYNPSHLLGLFSVYNSSTIRNSKLYKSGFPARYGGRISSVFDVRTKEGDLKKISGEANANLINASLSLEGPIVKDKSSFFISGRTSYVNYLLEDLDIALFEDDSIAFPLRYRFYDINAKFNYSFSQKDKLYLSYYNGGDVFQTEGSFEFEDDYYYYDFILNELRFKLNWGNEIFSLRWNHLFNDKLFSNTTLTYSRFKFNIANFTSLETTFQGISIDGSYGFLEYQNNIEDVGIKVDFDYIPSTKHYIRFGIGYTNHAFGISNIEESGESFIIDENNFFDSLIIENDDFSYLNSNEFHLYFEDDITFSEKLKANIGIRSSFYTIDDEPVRAFIEPRLSANYFLNKKITLNTSLSRNTQYLHLLSTGVGIPADVWIPSVGNVKPQTAWQATLGFDFFPSKNSKIKVEGFHKTMNNLIDKQGTIYDIDVNDFDSITTDLLFGKGTAYGLEFSFHQQLNKANFFFNYSLSKSEREFEELNFGQPFPFQFDRRHAFQLGFKWQLHRNIQLLGNWVYYTGTPRVLLENLATVDPGLREQFNPAGSFNSVRMDDYHRLDVHVRFHFEKKRFSHTLLVGAKNVYNKKNTSFVEVKEVLTGNEYNYELNNVYILPFLPSLSYTFKF